MLDADQRKFAEECCQLRLEHLATEKGLWEEARTLKDFSKKIEEIEVELEALWREGEDQKRRQVMQQRQQRQQRRQQLQEQSA